MTFLTDNVKRLAGERFELVNQVENSAYTSLELLEFLFYKFGRIFAEEITLGESVAFEFKHNL